MDSTKAGPTPNVRTNRYTAATTTRQTRTGATSRHRRDNQRDNLDELPTEDTNSNRGKASKGTCMRKSMYVDFHEIGWSDWIIYPVGYNANECYGNCPFPLGQTVQPSNHATVQSLMHLIAADVAAPCCVPSQLDPIVVLFFDSDSNVVLKQFDNMVATACGCRWKKKNYLKCNIINTEAVKRRYTYGIWDLFQRRFHFICKASWYSTLN